MDCSRCGHPLPEAPPPYCPQCGAPTAPEAPVVTFTPRPPEPPPIVGPLRDGPPWERRGSFLDLGAMGRTIGGVLLDAPNTFRTMKRDGGVAAPPVLLAARCRLLLGGRGLGRCPGTVLFRFGGGEANPLYEMIGMEPGTLMMLQVLMAPVLCVLVWFIWSGIAHLFLMLVGGARSSFETTLRVMAYAMGATAVFQLVPICGGLIGLLWGLVVEIIGLAEAHETSTGRAAAAVLLPIVLCCLCVVIGALVAVAMGVSLLDGLKT